VLHRIDFGLPHSVVQALIDGWETAG